MNEYEKIVQNTTAFSCIGRKSRVVDSLIGIRK